MSKMSQLHAETASDRADSAESDLRYLHDVMRAAAGEIRLHANTITGRVPVVASMLLIVANDLEAAIGKGA